MKLRLSPLILAIVTVWSLAMVLQLAIRAAVGNEILDLYYFGFAVGLYAVVGAVWGLVVAFASAGAARLLGRVLPRKTGMTVALSVVGGVLSALGAWILADFLPSPNYLAVATSAALGAVFVAIAGHGVMLRSATKQTSSVDS